MGAFFSKGNTSSAPAISTVEPAPVIIPPSNASDKVRKELEKPESSSNQHEYPRITQIMSENTTGVEKKKKLQQIMNDNTATNQEKKIATETFNSIKIGGSRKKKMKRVKRNKTNKKYKKK